MKYIKLFEKLKTPKVGDYVLIFDDLFPDDHYGVNRKF